MNVTIGEFNYLREKMVKDLVVMLMERRGMTYEEAFRVLYQSQTFANLSNPETGLFYQSPGYIFSYIEDELSEAVSS